MSFPLETLICYEVPDKIRLGKKFDGGYVLADNLKYDAFISCGISKDDSFEKAFLEKHPSIKCFAFDGTINRKRKPQNWTVAEDRSLIPDNERIIFTRKNIGGEETDRTTNLKEIINQYENIFLKMDIEGGEYDWIPALTKKEFRRIKQMVLEIHYPFEEHKWECIKKLNRTHYLVHLHPNNWCGVTSLEENDVPNVFECAYVRKHNLGFQPALNKSPIPSSIDQKNIKRVPDIELKGWPYVFSEQ